MIIYQPHFWIYFYLGLFSTTIHMDMNRQMFIQIEIESNTEYCK